MALKITKAAKGKPLAELQAEIEFGLNVYPIAGDYCCVLRMHYPESFLSDPEEYMYVRIEGYKTWHTWGELLDALGDYAKRPIWSTRCVHKLPSSEDEVREMTETGRRDSIEDYQKPYYQDQ